MKRFKLDTGIFNRQDKPVVIIRATDDEVNKFYHKVTVKAAKEIGDSDILLMAPTRSALIRYNEDRTVQDTMFVQPEISNRVMKDITKALDKNTLTVSDVFNKTGVKELKGDYTEIPVKLFKYKEKEITSNIIDLIATEINFPVKINIYKIQAFLYEINREDLEDLLSYPLDLKEDALNEHIYKGENIIFAAEGVDEAAMYSSSYDFIQLNNFDNSLLKVAKKADDYDYWFSDLEFAGEIKEFAIMVSSDDNAKSDVTEQAKEMKRIPPAYKDIEKLDFLVNLNKEAEEGKLTEVVGRKEELNKLLKNLLRIKKPSNIIIGPAGVGKSALYELLAQEIVKGNVPKVLQDLILVDLNIGSALAGTRYRGEFEEKIHQVIRLIQKYPNIVLVIDEVHQIVGAGESSESTVDMSNMLKPYLARGKVRIIGSTTKEEYEKYIKPQDALARRFNIIEMYEPNKAETLEMMASYVKVIKDRFEVDLSKRLEEIYEDCKNQKGKMPDIALEAMETVAIEEFLNRKEVSSCQ